MARANRGGSVLGFSIAAVVMAGLLVGGAYTLRQLTSQPVVAQGEAPQAKPDDGQSSENKANTSQNPDSTSQNNNAQVGATPSSSNSQASQLPHTGPGELLTTVAAIGSLSATAVAYARSRRPELSL
jgi:hypothetical protein